ncbi:tetratricopeptide repeat protein [Olivibacter sitiensis]|uniref:tetratricopeptide repeat protein n=1 Tax=Olivibacter sitiensis TaxID=376470 RepID=UPI0004096085|nr:membrane protein [Olivibacter sitiensis]
MPNFIRIILAFALLGASVTLMVFGHWGWGITVLLLSILVFVTFFFNENMLIAQFYLRKENMDKAKQFLDRITNYEKQLIRAQHGYYHLLIGLIESRKSPLQSEKYFKKALSLGMQMDHNIALAKLSLAGIAMSKRNKREALQLLQEAKRADKNKLLADQIKMMKDQMSLIDKQQHQQMRYR